MAKQISLKSLQLRNFKGIKELEIDFSKVTNIYGENGTGKTSIMDAFTWLLFDKDSKDRVVGDKESNFQIKTLDKSGNVIHGLEHEVISVLVIEGKEITLSKIYKEKWTKKRGEAERNLTGHETLYNINYVPVKKKEYQEFMNSIIDENLFKLLSNVFYFSINVKPQDRTKMLMDVVGGITDEKVINYKKDLEPLLELLGDKDIDTLKKSGQARKRKLNEEIKSIPYRVDECNNSIKEIDFEALEFRKRGIVSGIKSLEEQLFDSSKVNEEVLKEKDRLYSLKSKLSDMEYKASMEVDKPKRELELKTDRFKNQLWQIECELNNLIDKKALYEKQADTLNKKADELRNEWFDVNSKELEFNENEFVCPTCKRPFDVADIENKKRELRESFNQSKAKKLSEIQAQGKGTKENIEKVRADIQDIKDKIETSRALKEDKVKEINELKEEIKNYMPKDPLIGNKEYEDLKAEILELEQRLNQPTTVNNQAQELKERKFKLEIELEEVNKELAYKEQNEKLKNRIQELQEEEKKLAQQIAALEGQEFLCEEFIKTKVELLESSINNKFKYVSFKLFNTQVNGGLDETCEALINGVPFSNANTASQFNAGLDIINALSEHYGVQAPIFIDNRESVNQLIETDSQVINLIVSKDKNLKVEVM